MKVVAFIFLALILLYLGLNALADRNTKAKTAYFTEHFTQAQKDVGVTISDIECFSLGYSRNGYCVFSASPEDISKFQKFYKMEKPEDASNSQYHGCYDLPEFFTPDTSDPLYEKHHIIKYHLKPGIIALQRPFDHKESTEIRDIYYNPATKNGCVQLG